MDQKLILTHFVKHGSDQTATLVRIVEYRLTYQELT
jgi:hypothetical protein